MQISRSTSRAVRQVTDFGARLRAASAIIPPSAWRANHLWPVLREIPNCPQSSVTVKRPLRANLANCCF